MTIEEIQTLCNEFAPDDFTVTADLEEDESTVYINVVDTVNSLCVDIAISLELIHAAYNPQHCITHLIAQAVTLIDQRTKGIK